MVGPRGTGQMPSWICRICGNDVSKGYVEVFDRVFHNREEVSAFPRAAVRSRFYGTSYNQLEFLAWSKTRRNDAMFDHKYCNVDIYIFRRSIQSEVFHGIPEDLREDKSEGFRLMAEARKGSCFFVPTSPMFFYASSMVLNASGFAKALYWVSLARKLCDGSCGIFPTDASAKKTHLSMVLRYELKMRYSVYNSVSFPLPDDVVGFVKEPDSWNIVSLTSYSLVRSYTAVLWSAEIG